MDQNTYVKNHFTRGDHLKVRLCFDAKAGGLLWIIGKLCPGVGGIVKSVLFASFEIEFRIVV